MSRPKFSPTDIFSMLDMSAGIDGCWWALTSYSDKGIPQVTIAGKKVTVYRLTYELAHGPIPAGQLIRHTCHNGPVLGGKKCCANPKHLIPGTHEQNMDDMKKAGRSAKKLYPGHVRHIREWAAMDMTQQAIATRLKEQYGVVVRRETIRDVLAGKNHEYLLEEEGGQDVGSTTE